MKNTKPTEFTASETIITTVSSYGTFVIDTIINVPRTFSDRNSVAAARNCRRAHGAVVFRHDKRTDRKNDTDTTTNTNAYAQPFSPNGRRFQTDLRSAVGPGRDLRKRNGREIVFSPKRIRGRRWERSKTGRTRDHRHAVCFTVTAAPTQHAAKRTFDNRYRYQRRPESEGARARTETLYTHYVVTSRERSGR